MNRFGARNRAFLRDLFAGPFRGHGIIACAPSDGLGPLGDFAVSSRPVADWVPHYVREYEARVRQLETFQDDAVPYVGLNTTTGVFAAAFGCPLHVYEGQATNAAARPIVRAAAEADRLPEPDLDAPTLARVFELGRLLRRELGPQVPLGVPDIQSPFDIAALIWNKEEFYVGLVEEPEAVKRLVAKCHRLLERFLRAFRAEFAECNLCHCPYAWAPPDLGCWLSEDEVGSLSPRMFDEFCLPVLADLSRAFGGLFVHCCANADHQYGGFLRIPGLRGLNRVFQAPGPEPAVEAFAGRAVLIQAWADDDLLARMLDAARPGTRFLFNLDPGPAEEVMPRYERLRARCPRSG